MTASASSLSAQSTPIAIKAGTLIDGKGGTQNNVVIVVQDSKIVRIEPARAGVTYDLSTQTVMPGLIDTHTHLFDHFDRTSGRLRTAAIPETPAQTMLYMVENAHRTLQAGFTTVQSPGNELDKDLRDWINDGRVPGPRILTSLRQIFDNTGSPAEIRAFVRKAVADGADFVKIFATGASAKVASRR
jgi:imidazolonepropionase-like amidohydrolase